MNHKILFNLILVGGLISCGSNKKTVTYKHYNPKNNNKAVVVIPKEDLDEAKAVFNRIKNKAINPNPTTLDYIANFAPLAMIEMNRYKIPSSITLAQAILESKSGRSELSLKSNNHFGVKCHKDWQGKKVYYNDDKRHECFRKYNHPIGSFKDHSLFLRNGERYSFLFRLKRDDYKGWAYGLKKAGYATDPRYPQKLIKIIKNYHLSEYDTQVLYHQINKKEKAIARAKAKADKKVIFSPLSKEVRIKQVRESDSTASLTANQKINKELRINTFKVVNGKMVYAITSTNPKTKTLKPHRKEVASNTAKKVVEQPIKKPVKIVTKRPVKQLNKKIANQSVINKTKKPTKEIASNTAKKIVKQPIKKPVKIVTKKYVNQPNKKLADIVIKKPINSSNNYKLDKLKLKTPIKPQSKKIKDQSISKSDKLPVKKLVLKPTNKPVSKPQNILIKPLKTEIYKVKKGETLYSISKKFNVKVSNLKTWNNLVSNDISINQKIIIKQLDKLSTKKLVLNPINKSVKQPQNILVKPEETQIYKVKKGETLYSISKKFNVTVGNLKTWNNLTSNNVQINQELIINKQVNENTDISKNKTVINKVVKTDTYIVKKGETLYAISKKFNVNISDLKILNKLTSNNLKVGQKLIIKK